MKYITFHGVENETMKDLDKRVKALESNSNSSNINFLNSSSNPTYSITPANRAKIYNVTELFFNNNPNPNYERNEGLIGPNGILTYDSVNKRLIPNSNSVGKKFNLIITIQFNNPSIVAGDAVTFAIAYNSVSNTTPPPYNNTSPIFDNDTKLSSLTLDPQIYYKEPLRINFYIPIDPTDESRVNGFKLCLINRNNTACDMFQMKLKITGTGG
jgi:hypothetical protein